MKHLQKNAINEAVEILKQGGVLIFPTETAYGIGCDATNSKAVKRVLKIKNRDRSKGLPVIVPSLEKVKQHLRFSQSALELAKIFWPGALNIIVPRKSTCQISDLCQKDGNQSVRVSSHPIAQALTEKLEKPIVATSANISGESSIYSAEEIEKSFEMAENRPDAWIDAGDLPKTPVSTTILAKDDKIKVLRKGMVVIPQEFL